MKGRAIPYSAAELAWIEENCAFTRRDLHRFFVMFFGRTDVAVKDLKALCSRKGWKTGRDGRFPKGSIPPNKGRKGMPMHPNCAATQFRKGQLPHNTKWLGHERVSKDGYVEISIAETNPYTGYDRRYVLKHRHLWEQAHGPLPAGMCLKCLDGNKQNTDPANWEAVPRALLPRLAGRWTEPFDSAPAELKPTLLAIAKVEHAARTASRRRRRSARAS